MIQRDFSGTTTGQADFQLSGFNFAKKGKNADSGLCKPSRQTAPEQCSSCTCKVYVENLLLPQNCLIIFKRSIWAYATIPSNIWQRLWPVVYYSFSFAQA